MKALPRLRVTFLVLFGAVNTLTLAAPAWAHHTGFEKAEYQVPEDAALVDLVVGSAPCCPGPSGQVDYHTSNSSAVAGEDYLQTSGTLTFPSCYASGCTIRVPITNDDSYETEEQFEVKLTNWRGVFEPSRTVAIVKIIDDDPKPSLGSTSTGGSSKLATGALGSSSARPSSPLAANSASSGSASDPGNQSAPIIESTDDPTHRDKPVELKPSMGGVVRDDNRLSPLLLAGLGILLLGSMVAAGFGLKKRLGPTLKRRG